MTATTTAMTAEVNRAIANMLITEFEQEAQTTIRVISAVPESGCGYQPDPKSKTALGLVRHLVSSDEGLLNGVINGVLGRGPDESDKIATPSDGAALYGQRISAALAKIKALSDADLDRTIDFFGFMQVSAVQLLSMSLKHSIHHRGQLSSYLRAAGGKVPGIYGPSGDSQ